jgi:hypothetical protein
VTHLVPLDGTRTDVWSYGGGTQSIAIAVLVSQGRLPKPARVVIADTGREARSTWEYTDQWVRPLLSPLGLTVEVVGHNLSTVDLYGHNGDLLLPVFTETGKMPTLCSNEWKKRVIRRYLRSVGYGPDKPIRMWLGMSVDEMHRAGPSDVDWLSHHYPLLLDVQLRREECRTLILKAGLPDPPRSACWMCPHRQNDEWAALPADEFDKAVALDEEIRVKHPGVYLHRSSKPLRDVDLTPVESALPLFPNDGCESGYCYV